MRYWAKAPEPGSFQEEIALTVEAYEEFRQFEYTSAIIVGNHYSKLEGKKPFEATMKMLGAMQEKFFGDGVTGDPDTKKVAEEDQEEFLDLMENTFAVVHGDRLQHAAANEQHKTLPTGQPLIYNENPRGELLD